MKILKKTFNLFVSFLMIAVISLMCVCCESNIIITEILLEDTNDERIEPSIFTNDFREFKGGFTVTPNNVDCDELELVFSNEDLIEDASIDKGIITDDYVYKFTPKYNGKVEMYIQSKDGTCKSETKTFYFSGGSNNPSQKAQIGDVVTDYYYNVDFKVTKIKNATSFTNGYYSITTENNFLLIELEIVNNGKSAFYVNPNNFVVRKFHGDKLISTFEYDSRTYRFEDAMSSYDLNYGIKKSFTLLYEIDQNTTTGDYRLICQGVANNSGAVIYLK